MSSRIDIAATTYDRPPMLDDRWLFGHPRGLGLLFITEMWERFSYYGMRGILILYLTQALKWDTQHAASLYGSYTSFVYLTPIVGGWLADQFIGTRRSLVIGGVIIAMGHFSLAFTSTTMFYVGLTLIIIGTGFFKPNVSTMVGQIYPAGDPRRDSGFTIFYMGINLGAALGGFVCGYLADTTRFGEQGWHYAFAAAGVGMLAGLAVYLWGRERYLPGIGVGTAAMRKPTVTENYQVTLDAPKTSYVPAIAGIVVGAIVGLLIGGVSLFPILIGATFGGAIGHTVVGSHGEDRKRVIAIFIVVLFATAFWAAYEQAGSSMNLFAANATNLVVNDFHIPPAWFQNVNPIIILVCAPLFAVLWAALGRIGLEPSTALKMTIGLALLAAGFVFMVIGGGQADGGALVSPMWLVWAYTFHTLGELCLSPVGLSYVTKVAPARLASLLMGVWFLSNFAANKIAGALAGFTPTPGQPPAAMMSGLAGFIQRTSLTYHGFFSIFVVVPLVSAGVMLLCVPLLKWLTRSVKA